MYVHWHRRDLRLADNRGLAAAADREPVVPVFVLDDAVLEHASPIRISGLLSALAALRERYRDRGSDLVVLAGDPREVLPELAVDLGAEGVGWNDDYSGLAADRDAAVRAAVEEAGLEAESHRDAIFHGPGSITPNQGEFYSVYSYFWKKWRDREKAEPIGAPTAGDLADVSGDPLPSAADLGFPEPEADPPEVGPGAARDRLEAFVDGPIYRYDEDRDYPTREGTSRLSVHLKWGTIGIREVYAATVAALEGADDEAEREAVEEFQSQLAWREFYAHVLHFNPETVHENFNEYEEGIEWRTDPEGLAAWKRGETGYPIVDAGMRQLRREGYVHNRVRMIAASFLTKDLLIDWREGYDWYRRKLADHETANDVGGWQWAASTGTDAQPYFRIFNPMTQGERYDPDAEYVREYVPALAGVPADAIHSWHELPVRKRRELAPEYPDPIVDHAERREEALETFRRARGEE